MLPAVHVSNQLRILLLKYRLLDFGRSHTSKANLDMPEVICLPQLFELGRARERIGSNVCILFRWRGSLQDLGAEMLCPPALTWIPMVQMLTSNLPRIPCPVVPVANICEVLLYFSIG
jgi:hypothetical protein